MNKRLKEIRLLNKMSQEEFGRRIGIESRGHVSTLENGTRNITDRTIKDVCREFNINEDWLRYGMEPMTLPASAKLSTYLGEISAGDDYLIQDIIEVYMELDQKSKDTLRIVADKFVQKRLEREQN